MANDDDWLMGALASQDAYGGDQSPDIRPYPRVAQPPPASDTNVWGDQLTEQQQVAAAAEAAAARVRQPYAQAIARDPQSNKLGALAAGVAPGIAKLVMAPGQALQTTYDNPMTTEEAIKPAADIAMSVVGGGTPFAPEGALGMAGGRAPKPEKSTGFVPGAIAEPYDYLTGTRPSAPYPQFAERYPDTGPPTMVPVDPGKGEGFRPEKTLTPEAEQFAKTREKIIKDMRENGYEPFFDPSQRFPADFAAQPVTHADTINAVAAKQETINKHLETIDAPETRQALRDAYSKGLDLPDSQAWYYLGQVERKMKQDLGEVEGAKRFRDQLATAMSATTTGMNPQQNLIMAMYLNHLKATGQPLPKFSYETPVTVGGQRTMPNVEAYDALFSGPQGPYETLQAQAMKNPKRADFAQAQMGNPNAFTVDEQMTHGMIRQDVPTKGTYGLITNIGREEAAKAGVEPQRYQDVAWAGFKKMLEDEARAKKGKEPLGAGAGYQGRPMISEINDMIERTHRLTGMPRQEIWTRGFLKNEIPLYTAGGLTAGGAAMGELARQDQYQQ